MNKRTANKNNEQKTKEKRNTTHTPKKKPMEKANTEDKSRDMNNHFQKKIGTSNGNQRLHRTCTTDSELLEKKKKNFHQKLFQHE